MNNIYYSIQCSDVIELFLGGSVIKIVYKPRSPSVSGLQFVSFARQQLDDAVSFLKENCLIQRFAI